MLDEVEVDVVENLLGQIFRTAVFNALIDAAVYAVVGNLLFLLVDDVYRCVEKLL